MTAVCISLFIWQNRQTKFPIRRNWTLSPKVGSTWPSPSLLPDAADKILNLTIDLSRQADVGPNSTVQYLPGYNSHQETQWASEEMLCSWSRIMGLNSCFCRANSSHRFIWPSRTQTAQRPVRIGAGSCTRQKCRHCSSNRFWQDACGIMDYKG